jgi:arylsulfatase A-like enzyme
MKKLTKTLSFLFTFFSVTLTIFSQIGYNLKQKYNILFIAVDDLKPILGCYGNKTVISPNIDEIAQNGTVFYNAECQQAISGPSRASLLTGLRPDNTKVWELFTQMREVNPETITLPEHLKNNGYETAAVGKVFDLSCVDKNGDTPSWSIPYVNVFTDEMKDNFPSYKKRIAVGAPDLHDSLFIDVKIANKGIELLETLKKKEKPFFLAIGFLKPHLPFIAPKRYWDLYDENEIGISAVQERTFGAPEYTFQPSWELRSGYVDIPKNDPLPVQMQKDLRHGYYACITHVDDQIEKLLNKLNELGLRKNTVIVLWGDHGYHLGDHQMWCKHTNFEQAARTTLIISVPNIDGSKKTFSPTELIDIFPTICDITGVSIPQNLDGKSLLPVLVNSNYSIKDYAVTQYHRTTKDGIKLEGYSLRTKRYRYTEWVKGLFKSKNGCYSPSNVYGCELYDYESDPLEMKNLITNDKYEKVKIKMSHYMKEYFKNQNRYKD